MNYTLAHVLHLTHKRNHFIATALTATSRGFASSFGSAVGGGIFGRALLVTLRKGFEDRNLTGKDDLVKNLLSRPALVSGLTGDEREIALEGYAAALKTLFTAGAVLALLAVVVQAGTGWKAGADDDRIGNDDESTEVDDR